MHTICKDIYEGFTFSGFQVNFSKVVTTRFSPQRQRNGYNLGLGECKCFLSLPATSFSNNDDGSSLPT